jgi:hypothetical protein
MLAGETALVFIFLSLASFCCPAGSPLIPRASFPAARFRRRFAEYTKCSYPHLAICHFLVALPTSRLVHQRQRFVSSLPRLLKPEEVRNFAFAIRLRIVVNGQGLEPRPQTTAKATIAANAWTLGTASHLPSLKEFDGPHTGFVLRAECYLPAVKHGKHQQASLSPERQYAWRPSQPWRGCLS